MSVIGDLSEKPTLFELGMCLERMAKAIESIPYRTVAYVEEEAMVSIFRIEDKLREAIKTLNGFEIRLDELENQIMDDMNRRFRHLERKRDELQRHISELEPIRIPESQNMYGLKQLIETLSQLASMNESTWERLKWIMTAVAKVEQPKE